MLDIVLLVLAATFLLSLAVLLGMRSVRVRRNVEQRFAELGFTQLASADTEALYAQLARLHAASTLDPSGRAGQMYVRRQVDRSTYVYQTGGGSSPGHGFVVVSDSLQLPRFTLFPNIQSGGILGQLANQAAEAALSRLAHPIALPSTGRFRERYDLYGEDAEKVLQFLTRDRMSRIADRPQGVLDAGENVFVFVPFVLSRADGGQALSTLRTQLMDVDVLFDVLTD